MDKQSPGQGLLTLLDNISRFLRSPSLADVPLELLASALNSFATHKAVLKLVTLVMADRSILFVSACQDLFG